MHELPGLAVFYLTYNLVILPLYMEWIRGYTDFWLSLINSFHATVLFLYPLKISENFWFSDVFRGYRKRPVAWNRLTWIKWPDKNPDSWIFYVVLVIGKHSIFAKITKQEIGEFLEIFHPYIIAFQKLFEKRITAIYGITASL